MFKRILLKIKLNSKPFFKYCVLSFNLSSGEQELSSILNNSRSPIADKFNNILYQNRRRSFETYLHYTISWTLIYTAFQKLKTWYTFSNMCFNFNEWNSVWLNKRIGKYHIMMYPITLYSQETCKLDISWR